MSDTDLTTKLREAIDLINKDLVKTDTTESTTEISQIVSDYKAVLTTKDELKSVYEEITDYYTHLCETAITASAYNYYIHVAIKACNVLNKYLKLIKISMMDNNIIDIINKLSAALYSDNEEDKTAIMSTIKTLIQNMESALGDTLSSVSYADGVITDTSARRYTINNTVTVLQMGLTSSSSLLTAINAILVITYKEDGTEDKVVFSCPTIKVKNLLLDKRTTVSKWCWGLLTITRTFYEGIVDNGDEDAYGIRLEIKNPDLSNLFAYLNKPRISAGDITDAYNGYYIVLRKGYSVKENTIQEPLMTYSIEKSGALGFQTTIEERTVYEDTDIYGTEDNPAYYYLEDNGEEITADKEETFPLYKSIVSGVTWYFILNKNDKFIYTYNGADVEITDSTILDKRELYGIYTKNRLYINVKEVNYTPILSDSEKNTWITTAISSTYDENYADKISYGLTDKSSDGETVSIGEFKAYAKRIAYKNTATVKLSFDSESFDLKNKDSIADYVDVEFSTNNSNISIEPFTLNAGSKSNNTFEFTNTISVGQTDASYSTNTIPLKLNVRVNDYTGGTSAKLSLDLGMNTDDNTIATDTSGYLSIGMLSFPEVEVESISKITASEVGSDFDYALAYGLGSLSDNVNNDSYTIDNLYNISEALNLAITAAVNKINSLTERLYASLNSLSVGEPVRESYDSGIDTDEFSSISSSISSLTTNITSLDSESLVTLEENITRGAYSDITNQLTNIYNETNQITVDCLDELFDTSHFMYNYSPLMGLYDENNRLRISVNALINLYTGNSDFSSAIDYGGTKFIKMSVNNAFIDWYSSVSSSFIDSHGELEMYYILKFVLYNSDSSLYDYLIKLLNVIYNNRLIDRSINFKDSFISVKKDELKLTAQCGLIFSEYKNSYKLPTSLDDISKDFYEFNEYDISDLTPYADNYAINGDVINYIFAKNILKHYANNDLDSTLENISIKCTDLSSYRNIIFLIYLENMLNYLYEKNYLKIDYLYEYKFPELSELKDYARRYNNIYNAYKNIQIENILNFDGDDANSITEYLK